MISFKKNLQSRKEKKRSWVRNRWGRGDGELIIECWNERITPCFIKFQLRVFNFSYISFATFCLTKRWRQKSRASSCGLNVPNACHPDRKRRHVNRKLPATYRCQHNNQIYIFHNDGAYFRSNPTNIETIVLMWRRIRDIKATCWCPPSAP